MIQKWLKKLPLRSKLSVLFILFAVNAISVLCIGGFGMYAISGLRAYVNAEAHWAKNQKNAVCYLSRYADFQDETYRLEFLEYIQVPLSYKTARLELEKKRPDDDIAYQAFIGGGCHHEDIPAMIFLFKWFRNFKYIDKAISIWEKGDREIANLISMSDTLHGVFESGNASHVHTEKMTPRISEIDAKLKILEDNFSYTLGEASRWANQLFLQVMIVLCVFFVAIGVMLIISVSNSILSGISGMAAASEEIAAGNVGRTVTVESADEIGFLAKNFNQMSTELKKQKLEIVEATDQAIQSEKLSALGEMAASIVHELNQPLNGIKIISQSCMRDIEKKRFQEDAIGNDLKEIVQYVNKMSEIIDHIRVYSRKSEGTGKETVTMNSVIEDILKLQAQQLKSHNIDLVKRLSQEECNVSGNPIRLEQLLINLIVNARDAVDASGRDDKKIEIKTDHVDDGQTVVIEISDNGNGIPEEIRDKIFNSFFTTKAPGKGTGLGLSMVKKIIDEHAGSIEVVSKKGEGTQFIIQLPAAKDI